MTKVQKVRNDGKWTEARFNQFIRSALRSSHGRWGPKAAAKAKARVSRGVYRCAACNQCGPATLPPLEGRKRRRNNACVDHINPVVDPCVGFVDWDTYIERMFVEEEGYQILCWQCHEDKTNAEREVAKQRRAEEREE